MPTDQPFRFSIQDTPIAPDILRAELADPRAGALIVFEGQVRDLNDGRAVNKLEYEAATDLAENEFGKIAEECLEKFEIIRLLCVHRVGSLDIGDIAVWIGVLSAHRGPGYDASRYLIEELKKRVPIWKKEHYSEGDSGWINSP